MQDGFRIKLDIACFALFQTLIFAILAIEHFLIVSKAIWQIKLFFFYQARYEKYFRQQAYNIEWLFIHPPTRVFLCNLYLFKFCHLKSAN